MGLTDVDKSEILKAIDEEIKNKTVSTSGAFGTLSDTQVAAMIPDFSQRYPGIQLASLGNFSLGGGGGDWDGQDRIVENNNLSNSPYALSNTSKRSLSQMGGGTGLNLKPETTNVLDKANLDIAKKQLAQAKTQAKSGSDLKTQEANDVIARQTKALKSSVRKKSLLYWMKESGMVLRSH